NARTGHVDHNRAAFLSQAKLHRQGQRKLFADVATGLVDDCQAVGVRVENKANLGTHSGDERQDRLQILRQRLRGVSEIAILVIGNRKSGGAERGEQLVAEVSASTSIRIQ